MQNNGKIVPIREQNQGLRNLRHCQDRGSSECHHCYLPIRMSSLLQTSAFWDFSMFPFSTESIYYSNHAPPLHVVHKNYLILSSLLGFLIIRLKGVTPRSLGRTGNHPQIPDHELGAMTALIPKGWLPWKGLSMFGKKDTSWVFRTRARYSWSTQIRAPTCTVWSCHW